MKLVDLSEEEIVGLLGIDGTTHFVVLLAGQDMGLWASLTASKFCYEDLRP